MRNPASRFLFALALVAAFATTGCDDDDDGPMVPGEKALVRVGHLSPDAPPVDVLVNGAVVLQDVPFTAFSNYLELDAGSYEIQVTPANDNATVVIDEDVTVSAGVAYTVIATGLLDDSTLGARVLVDDLTRDAANATIRFVHASPGTPNVDITLPTGAVLFDDVAFGAADEDLLKVPGGSYDLQARVAGTSTIALWFEDVPVSNNTVYTVYAVGLLADGSLRAVVTVDDAMSGSTKLDLTPATTRLRVAHLSPDAPNVDVWLDGALVGALVNVPYPAVSNYLTVSAGSHRVQVFVTGTSTGAVIDVPVTLSPDFDYTAAATGSAAELGTGSTTELNATVVAFDRIRPAAGQTRVRFVHASFNAPAVDVRVVEGPTLFSGSAFRDIEDFVSVDAGSYDLEVLLSPAGDVVLELPGVALGGGDVVTVYAVGLAGDEDTPLSALTVLD